MYRRNVIKIIFSYKTIVNFPYASKRLNIGTLMRDNITKRNFLSREQRYNLLGCAHVI